VRDFISEHRIVEHIGKGKKVVYLNKYPLEEVHRKKITYWSGKKEVSLKALDEVLVRYGLSIREFETWCERKGIDPVSNGGISDHATVGT
jgi:hypothetical protein